MAKNFGIFGSYENRVNCWKWLELVILLIKTKMLKNKFFFIGFKLLDVAFIKLINVKMSTIIGILTFMSMINSMLSWVEDGIFVYYGGQALRL